MANSNMRISGRKDTRAPILPSILMEDESIVPPSKAGKTVQRKLRWGCDRDTADRICNYNRHYTEHCGYFLGTSFLVEASGVVGEMTFFDSNTGRPVFHAPKGRTMDEFLIESRNFGWLSFREKEVVWENVIVSSDGEVMSVDGSHLGHNIPDSKGSRFSINIVSVAGRPSESKLQM